MRRPCSVLVLFVLLGFGVSLGVPAEDVPETATTNRRHCLTRALLCSQSWCRWRLPGQLRRRQVPYTLDLVLHPGLPLRVSATPMPIDPPIHESHWPYSVLCSASNLGCLASLKNRSAISRGLSSRKIGMEFPRLSEAQFPPVETHTP